MTSILFLFVLNDHVQTLCVCYYSLDYRMLLPISCGSGIREWNLTELIQGFGCPSSYRHSRLCLWQESYFIPWHLNPVLWSLEGTWCSSRTNHTQTTAGCNQGRLSDKGRMRSSAQISQELFVTCPCIMLMRCEVVARVCSCPEVMWREDNPLLQYAVTFSRKRNCVLLVCILNEIPWFFFF